MNVYPLGRVNVTVSGTPKPLSTDPGLRAAHLLITAVQGMTGNIYIGSPTMQVATLAGVMRVLAPCAAGAIPDVFEIESHADDDRIYPGQYALDADISGEGALVTLWIE
jgi:hypothetical protein